MRTELVVLLVSGAVFLTALFVHPKKNVTALFTVRLVRIGAMVCIVFSCLSMIPGFEKSWHAVLAGSGIAAVVLGLAAQSTLSNVFAGIALSSVNKPFEIGDRVKIGEIAPGFVQNITLRHVELLTYMGQTVIVPNSTVQESVIVNYTKEDGNAYPVEITVGYDADLDLAIRLFEDTVNHHPKHYGTDCHVLVKEAGDYGITLKGTVMTKEFTDTTTACSDCLKEILKQYERHHISVPYPIVDVRVS